MPLTSSSASEEQSRAYQTRHGLGHGGAAGITARTGRQASAGRHSIAASPPAPPVAAAAAPAVARGALRSHRCPPPSRATPFGHSVCGRVGKKKTGAAASQLCCGKLLRVSRTGTPVVVWPERSNR